MLRTKGTRHSSLTGRFEHRVVHPDSLVITGCEIVDRYKSAEDAEGNCYDWYEIEKYESKVELSDMERDALNEEINGLVADCGELIEQLYESDLEYVIGE